MKISFETRVYNGSSTIKTVELTSATPNLLDTLVSDYLSFIQGIIDYYNSSFPDLKGESFRVDFFKKNSAGQFFVVNNYDDSKEKFKLLRISYAREVISKEAYNDTIQCDIE